MSLAKEMTAAKELKFGLTNTERLNLGVCWDIYTGDEVYENIADTEETARVVLLEVAGLRRGEHFTLYVNEPQTICLTAVLKVCADNEISVTLLHYNQETDRWHEQKWNTR